MLQIILFILQVLYDICVDVCSAKGFQKLINSHAIHIPFRDYTNVGLMLPFGPYRQAQLSRVKWSEVSLAMKVDGGQIHISVLIKGLVVALAFYDGVNGRVRSSSSSSTGSNPSASATTAKEGKKTTTDYSTKPDESRQSSSNLSPPPSAVKKRSWLEFLASCGLCLSVAFEHTNVQITVLDSTLADKGVLFGDANDSSKGRIRHMGDDGPILIAHMAALSVDVDLKAANAKVINRGTELCLLPRVGGMVRILHVASVEASAKKLEAKLEAQVAIGVMDVDVDADCNSHTHSDLMRLFTALVDTLKKRPTDSSLKHAYERAEERLFIDLERIAGAVRDAKDESMPDSSSSSSTIEPPVMAATVKKAKHSISVTLVAMRVFVSDLSRCTGSSSSSSPPVNSSLLSVEDVQLALEAGVDEGSCVANSSMKCTIGCLNGSHNKGKEGGGGQCITLASTSSSKFVSADDGSILTRDSVLNISSSGQQPLLLALDATLLCGLLNVVSDVSSAIRAAGSACNTAKYCLPASAAANKMVPPLAPGEQAAVASRTTVDFPSLVLALTCRHPLSHNALAVAYVDVSHLGVVAGGGATSRISVTVGSLGLSAFMIPFEGTDCSVTDILQRAAASAPVLSINSVAVATTIGSSCKMNISALRSSFLSSRNSDDPRVWREWLSEQSGDGRASSTSVAIKSCSVSIGEEIDITCLHTVLASVGDKKRPQISPQKSIIGSIIRVCHPEQPLALSILSVSIDSLSLEARWMPRERMTDTSRSADSFSFDDVYSRGPIYDTLELRLPCGLAFASTSAGAVCSYSCVRLRDEAVSLLYRGRSSDSSSSNSDVITSPLLTLRLPDQDIYSSTRIPLELYTSSRSGRSLVEGRVVQHVSLPSIFVVLNATDYSYMHRISALCSRCSAAIARTPLDKIATTAKARDVCSKEMLYFAPRPTKILDVKVAKLEVLFEYHGEKAASFEVSSVVFDMVDFGPNLGQMCGSLRSLQITDLTVASSVHRAIITNCTTSQNLARWHMTKQANEFPLLEIDVEFLRLFYLQRATMMLVSYFRDHLIPSFKAAKPFAEPLWTKPAAAAAAAAAPPRMGMMRFCIRIKVLECHVPTTCSSSDALVIIVKEGRIYKNCPLLDGAYNQGPLLAQGRVLSEEASIQAYLSGAAKHTWMLPRFFRGLKATRFALENSPPTSLDVSLGQCTFCSWCNENALCEGLDVHVAVTQTPIIPAYPGMYAEVFQAQGLAVNRPRNRLDVVIKTPTIFWKLAQGQYMAIVRLIQQNFQEQPSVVPDVFILPTPKLVHLTEGLYGKAAIDGRIPFNSFVSWIIDEGSIIALQNRPSYYDYIFRVPKHDALAADSIPAWSCHRLHLRNIMDAVSGSKQYPGNAGAGSRSSNNIELDDNNYFDSNVFKNSSLFGEPIMTLFLKDFYFDFVRKHYGYGNGINAYAGLFLISKPSHQFAREFDHEAEGMSVNDVAAEDIIFAPKSISSNGRKATSSSFDGHEDAGDGHENEQRPATAEDYKRLSHIAYNQEGLKNLRRIVISISDSMAVLHTNTISSTLAFFVEPITLNYHRNIRKLDVNGCGPLDFKAALDLEVRVRNLAICLPNSKIHGSCSALCINCDIDYEQAVRGFVKVGPGKVTRAVSLNIYSVFIAPIHEVEYSIVESLIDPCTVKLAMMTHVVPEDSNLASHMEKLNPWVDFSGFSAKASKADRAVVAKLISAEISPMDLDSDAETASVDKNDDRSEGTYDNSSSNGAPSSGGGITVRFSLQDIQFIVSCIKQLQESCKNGPIKRPILEVYAPMLSDISDIAHLPNLTFYLVNVPCERPWESGHNDVIIDICSLSLVLKNNTYNLKILKLDLCSNRISYNRTDDKLHSAVGITYSIWAFCESQEIWEPFLETSSVTAIAATDATTDITTHNSSIIRIEAHCNPIEVNISQSILASVSRKLALSDVVTTNSQELPPYRIINDLGVDMQSCIYVGHQEILVEQIAVGNQVPIDFKAVASTVNFLNSKRKRREVNRGVVNFSDREHLMGVRIVSNNHVYEARTPLPMGKEGVTPFDMRVARRKIDFLTTSQRNAQTFAVGGGATCDSSKAMVHRPQEIPLVFLSMRMKSDGAKELTVRSMVSLKNHTSRLMQLALWLGNEHVDTSLSPGAEWHVPLHFASPQTQLFLRPDERCEWIEALNSLSSLVVQGTWKAPQRLRADLCACPPECPVQGAVETSWVILLKPEARQKRTSGWAYTPVRYPSTDTYMSAQSVMNGDDHNTLDDLYHIRQAIKKDHFAQPVCINILPPLQLCNVVSQPLLYRIADKEGLITSEGTLLPGDVVDIHSLSSLFTTQIYISIRMVNYCWSKWVKLLSRRNPYSPTEKLSDITLASMELSNAGEDVLMPSLTLSLSLRDNVARLSCPIIVSNRSGLPLDFCESSSSEAYSPECAGQGVASIIGDKIAALQKSARKAAAGSGNDLNESGGLVSVSSADPDRKTVADRGDDEDNSDDDVFGGGLSAAVRPDSTLNHPNHKSNHSSVGRRQLHHGLVPLLVHFPSDHLRKIEVTVSSTWTLSDVFKRIASKMSGGGSALEQCDYVFFYWDDGKRGARKAALTPSDELDMFTRVSRAKGSDEGGAAGGSRDSGERGISESSPSTGMASAILASTKSLFKSSPAAKQQSGDGSVRDGSITQSSDSLPFSMQLAMLADFLQPLSLDTVVSGLSSSRLRLCHVTEYSVYKQVQSIRTTSVKKDSSVTNYIFNKYKFSHRAQFMRVEGDLPFNPRKMLGFSPSISVRVSGRESEWSDALDLVRADFNDYFNLSRERRDREGEGGGKGSISSSISSSISNSMGSHLSSSRAKSDKDKGKDAQQQCDYQLSFLVEKGHALYQHVTVVTIVPRYLVVSNIAYAVQLRQAGVLDGRHAQTLLPRAVLNFHYWSDSYIKLLQIRWADSAETASAPGLGGGERSEWSGEIDISKLGIVYAKLRNPMYILKVQVEVVGASLVATLSEQNLMFPPYRVQNSSSVSVRYRQALEANERYTRSGTQGPGARDAAGAELIPWDSLPAAAMTPYVWDRPVTLSHSLRLEAMTGNDSWRGASVKVDEDCGATSCLLTVQRSLPPLGNPQAEGFLQRRSPSDGSWQQAYCILKGHCIYLFGDSNRKELLSIVNLCKQQFGGLQVAKVTKPVSRRRESVQGMLEDAWKGSEGAKDRRIEGNKLRILTVLICDKCNVFDDDEARAALASRPPVAAKASISASLRRCLAAGDSIDQLLARVQENPLPVFQVLAALQMLGEADDEQSARHTCFALMSQGSITVAEPRPEAVGQSLDGEKAAAANRRKSAALGSPFPYSGRATITFVATSLFADLTARPEQGGGQTSDSAVANIFTVTLGGQKGYFKCSSDSELLGWLLGCRHSIETAWIKFVIGEPLDVVTIDKYFFNVCVRFSSDGPTKVIDLFDERAGTGSSGSADAGTDSIFDQLISSTVDADSSTKDPKQGLKFVLDEEEEEELAVPTPQHINTSFLISVRAEAISLSLVDQEPCEIFYLTLRDIDVTVDKVRSRLRVGLTVQDIQISNQLPSPKFPVMLCLRETAAATAGAHRLLLPGLHQQGSAFPALHIFGQQRQHKNFYRTVETVREKKMLYFDMVSVWIAPLQLELEEEVLVRVLRLSNEVRSDIVKPLIGSYNSVGDEIIAAQQASARSWGLSGAQQACSGLQQLLAAGREPYAVFAPLESSSRDMYFRLMQLHPIDIVVTMRPSPDFSLTATEMALVSVAGQLDSSRLKLNALIAEHAHGSASLIREIVMKHYKAALWTQFQRLLGNSDFVDGSFGVVANLGTGVYDLFYEPIDGLMDENSSFLSGLSRGGRSLASHTIGGTSAITSKVIGGIGKGVSMLTMDTTFYRQRGARRMNKSSTMSEGLYVGTKELGKNIADGISGIVLKPYQGYQEGGSVGLVTGIGKGLLGVALKPAVGVFDLAARATEGMRNSAIGSKAGATNKGYRSRARIPRAFGSGGLLTPYMEDAAAAQFIADQLLSDKSGAGGKRFIVAHFQYCTRYITDSMRTDVAGKFTGNASSLQPFNKYDVGFADFKVLREAWGMPIGNAYVALVSADSVALCQVGSERRGEHYDVRLVWKCPAENIDQIFSDARGDLVLNVHTSVTVGTATASEIGVPSIADLASQDYFVMQTLLEKSLGARLARMQPLVPAPQVGLVQRDVLKRYATGIKSLLKSPTKHSFQLYGYVLYEYTLPEIKKAERNSLPAVTGGGGGSIDSSKAAHNDAMLALKNTKRSRKDRILEWKVGDIFEKYVDSSFISNHNSPTNLKSPQEAVNRLSGSVASSGGLAHEGVLSYVYPLVDCTVCGPFPEDDGSYSINITRKDGLSMKVIKRDEDSHMLSEHHKSTLVLIFADNVTAIKWRHSLETHTALQPNDIIQGDDGGGMITNKLRNMAGMITGGGSGGGSTAEPADNSIGSVLVIPTSGSNPQYSERLKIEIARAMQSKYSNQS